MAAAVTTQQSPKAQDVAPPIEAPVVNPRQFGRNVGMNFAGHAVFIASGFILPRLINDHVGNVRLGIWDLGWSMVAYLNLLTLGITASTNRFVARYRTLGDWEALNRIVGACLLVFLLTGVLTVLLTFGVRFFIPQLLGPENLAHVHEAGLVLLLLGLTAAVQMPVSVPGGVITGCERYDLLNYIEAGCQVFLVAACVVALSMGCGLVALAACVLVNQCVIGLVKYLTARVICPRLVLSPFLATWSAIKEVSVFGGLLFLERGSRIALYQTCNFLIVSLLGPAALALYARPNALVQHLMKVMYQFGRVFTPMASALQAQSASGAKPLLVSATRQSLYVALPGALLLTIMGGSLLEVWMGEAFRKPVVLVILTLGHLGAMGNSAAYYVLLGLNRHGAVGVATLIASILGIALSATLVTVAGLGVIGIALGIAVSMSLLNFIVIPILAASSVEIPVRRYILETVPRPMTVVIPFAVTLLLVEYGSGLSAGGRVVVGALAGGVVLGLTYWYFVITAEQRIQIRRAVTRRLPRFLKGKGRSRE